MPKRPGCFTDFPISPLTGPLDLRSANGQLSPGSWRVVLNAKSEDGQKLCRLGGWRRLFSDSPYGFYNQDLHDQLLCLQDYYLQATNRITGGGDQVGSQFLYWTGEYSTSSRSVAYTMGLQCGYVYDLFQAPAAYGSNDTVLNGCFAYNIQVGTPYLINFPNYEPCNSGAPWFYEGSRFDVGCSTTTQTSISGYGYGPESSVFGSYFEYDYTYCYDQKITRYGCRQPITLLAEFASEQARKLIAGTQTTLYQLNERTGNWRIIADGLGGMSSDDMAICTEKSLCGCGGRRFSQAQLGNYMFFTNNLDNVLSYKLDDSASGCDLWSVSAVEDLIDLGVTRARCIAQWKGFIILGDVSEGADQFPYRVMWSDYNDGHAWDSAVTDSEAGYQDLGLNERIQAIKPLGDFLFIYTEHAIYQVVLVTTDEGRFRFREVYRGPDVPRFRYSIVDAGDAHYYMGEDAVFRFSLYDSTPRRVEWIHKASGAIYRGLSSDYLSGLTYVSSFAKVDRENCDEAVGFYDGPRNVVWFSWATPGSDCPRHSLRLDVRHEHASIVDHGFTAGLSYRPDTRPTVRDFLQDYQVCLASSRASLPKEGAAYPYGDAVFDNPPLYLFNAAEDPSQPLHPDSLCARWSNLRVQDICDVCSPEPILIMASATDYCLKQYDDDIAYRERFVPDENCTGQSSVTVIDGSVYCIDGYMTMIQTDMSKVGVDTEKYINSVIVDYEAGLQTTPNQLECDIAYGHQPACTTWHNIGSFDFECLTEESAAQHAANNTRPDDFAEFKCYARGRYIGVRTWIGPATGQTQVTGGLGCFNSMTLSIRNAQGGR